MIGKGVGARFDWVIWISFHVIRFSVFGMEDFEIGICDELFSAPIAF